jgi:hypothetical protein
MPSGLAKELVMVSSSAGSADSAAMSGSAGALVNSGPLSGLNGSQQINSNGITRIAEKLSKFLPRDRQAGSMQFLDTSINNLFDSIRMKNGPLVHQHTFDLTRLLEEEFYKTNLNGSGTEGSGLSNENEEGLESISKIESH